MSEFPAVLSLSSLNGRNGFRLDGAREELSGWSVSSAGDVNGDGFDDVIVGARSASPHGENSGSSYVVFGRADGFARTLDLSSLNGRNGFRLDGAKKYDASGVSVSSAGDVDGDGFDDVIVGAPGAGISSGASYVVFGHAGGFDRTLDLSDLNGRNGFRLDGAARVESSGQSVSSAGDVNGDGVDDLVIGAPFANPNGRDSGTSYVVFGQKDGFTRALDLASLNGRNGFRLDGVAEGDASGTSVSSAGDVNGDGFDDIVIGAQSALVDGESTGASYVVFGRAGGFDRSLDLSSLNGRNGFRIVGAPSDHSGASVSSAGDVNGDGFDDLIIGAPGSGGLYTRILGQTYVVFGRAGGFPARIDLSGLDGTDGFRLDGAINDYLGLSVSSAGDVDGDGFDDVIVGAPNDGSSYVVFGRAEGFQPSLDLSTLDGSNGFRIAAEKSGDQSGGSVSSAGDVNGDGFADLVVGALGADHNGSESGSSYVIFGRKPDMAVTRTGTVADQTLAGGDFDDTLNGLGGRDALYGNGGEDLLAGGADGDAIRGGRGDDTLNGQSGNDLLNGGRGRDTLIGQDGNDRLAGGLTADILVGGAGDDSFVFDAPVSRANADRIRDFRAADDVIRLEAQDFTGLGRGALDASAFKDLAEGPVDRDDRILYDSDTGALFFDRNGSLEGGWVKFAVLLNEADLSHRDFVVF